MTSGRKVSLGFAVSALLALGGVGMASPAYAVGLTIEASDTSVSQGESVTITTNAADDRTVTVAYGGMTYVTVAAGWDTPVLWEEISECDDVVMTVSVYDEAFVDSDTLPTVDADDSVAITFVGGGAECGPFTLTADKPVVTNGGGVIFTTNAPSDNLAAFFINGEYWGSGPVSATPNPFEWDLVAPCATVDATYRVYGVSMDDAYEPTWANPFEASVTVSFRGDAAFADCDDTWGASDPVAPELAQTGAADIAGVGGIAAAVVLLMGAALLVAARRRTAVRTQ